MNQLRRFAATVCVVSLPILLISGCSGGGTKVTLPSGSDTNAAALSSAFNELTRSAPTTAASSGTISPMKMRIVNLFAPNKTPGPALDIYDVQLNGQKATPIAANIAYGGVSSYFSPHVASDGTVLDLYALPAGEDPVAKKSDAQGFGGAQDDGSHPQITWVLTSDTGAPLKANPLDGLASTSWVEKGTNNGGKSPVAPSPPSGQGEIMVDTQAAPDQSAGIYIMIDDSCDPPLNGDPNAPGVPLAFAAAGGKAPASAFALFATSVSSHQVSVVAWADATAPTCAQLTAKQDTTTVDVSAGQQIEAYVYGTSDTDLHLALAPIQP